MGSVVENSRLLGDYQETLGMTLGIAKRCLTWGFVCRKLAPSATATRADDREEETGSVKEAGSEATSDVPIGVTNQKVADRIDGGGAPAEVVLGHAGVRPWVGRRFQRRVRPPVNWPKQPDGKVGPKRWTG